MIPLISERKSTFNDLSNSIFISYDISHKSNKLFVNPKITLRYHSFLLLLPCLYNIKNQDCMVMPKRISTFGHQTKSNYNE